MNISSDTTGEAIGDSDAFSTGATALSAGRVSSSDEGDEEPLLNASPAVPTTATTARTGRTWPGWKGPRWTMPEAEDSTGKTALSVSTSRIVWPFSTLSPSFTCQFRNVTSSIG